jgi:chromosome segregation ATPase
MLGTEVDMQKIRPAMERLNAALDRLEKHQKKSAANGGDMIGKQAEVDALAMQCAHLRAEVSSLKKKKAELEAAQTRAGVQIDKAMRQIDDVLGDA